MTTSHLASPDGVLPKLLAALGFVGAIAAVILAATTPAPERHVRAWTFAGLAQKPSSYALQTPVTDGGAWTIEAAPGHEGGRVLVNHPGSSDAAPALAIIEDLSTRDVDLATRCRGGCGLAFRVLDPAQFYVARADRDAGQVILAVVVGGQERELARAPIAAGAGEWLELSVHARDEAIEVHLDAAPVIAARDATLREPGSSALWAAPLGSASFDVLRVRSRPAS